ncbi:MAG: AEC family transporter [Bacteroidales bacterium]|jgi:predicted permease|nr:AEC family transporter [Bacteroidales bacterium]MDY0197079.1 AEC family transporter [Tenuifilaceae bacterium]
MATEIIVRQLLIFGVLIAVGALGFWRKIISIEMKNSLSRIVIDITLPFLIFTTFSNMDYEPELFRNGLIVFLLAFVNLFVLYIVGIISSKLLRLDLPKQVVHTLHTMFGNIVFLGFPLLDALFPNGEGVFYGAVYQLASNSITFTYGVYKLSQGSQKGGWRSLLNVNTAAIFLGVIVLAFSIKLPGVVSRPFELLGKSTSPLSMVYIGAMLASMNMRKALFQKSIFVLSFNKLFFAPLLIGAAYLAVMGIIGLELSKVAFFVLILQAAMPCQTIIVVLSHRYNGDYALAGANLFVTTLLSVLSLPLVYYCLDWLWQCFGKT